MKWNYMMKCLCKITNKTPYWNRRGCTLARDTKMWFKLGFGSQRELKVDTLSWPQKYSWEVHE
jgi:hypothetical protein